MRTVDDIKTWAFGRQDQPQVGSPGPSATSDATLGATSDEGGSATSPASSSASLDATSPASGSPLNTRRLGDKTRVVNGKAEWSPEDFGHAFVAWFKATYPKDWGTWIWLPDIRKHYLRRFRADTRARYLQLGMLIRGLKAVTRTRPVSYIDGTGKRRGSTEYWMGPT